jgi:hypothetical protein
VNILNKVQAAMAALRLPFAARYSPYSSPSQGKIAKASHLSRLKVDWLVAILLWGGCRGY